MLGQTVSHYKILEKLGGGGMGVVYKAEDTKLKRTVALKFLPPDLTRDPEAKERFIHEAQAASALQHNNICAIHDIDETADGQLFIVMDCYEGESLKERIGRGPLKTMEATDIAIQIAQGLAEAHAHGIIHRDVKPANILITKSDIAKIVDFGLAKLAGQSRLTKAGSTLGTAAYMSPEQARGEEVDARTDIWSLGVVVYQMLTGHLPFRGEHEAALMYSIVHEEPQSLSDFRTDIPKRIASAIYQALQKDPRQRYQSALDLLNNFKAAMTPAIQLPKQEKSIVVLPFENLSPDPDQEYFSDGLTEEVISDLSNVRTLRVISRSSAMTFKGTKKTIPEIARQVNVQYVLEGSVRKAGNNLRITAQLIDASNDAHLWAEKYSGTLDDVFGIQESFSRAIVEALKLKLTPEENKKIAERPIDNVQAYELHLRARYEMWLVSEERLNHALQLIQNGIQIMGDNEILYSDMGHIYLLYHDFAIRKEKRLFDKAEGCIKKIFDLNPESPYGHSLQANLLRRRGDCQEAVREWKRSLAIDPNFTDSIALLIWVYLHSGKELAARPLLRRLLKIDPLMPMYHMITGVAKLLEGRFDLALGELNNAHQMENEVQVFRFWIGKALAYAGRYQEALGIFESIEKQNTQSVWENLSSFSRAALQGRKSEALQYLTEDFKNLMREDEMYPLWMADNLALIEEKEEAVEWLEQGRRWGFINYRFLTEYDPFLKNLHGEERFKKLMERVKKESEEFEV